jgi:hypothetical protein
MKRFTFLLLLAFIGLCVNAQPKYDTLTNKTIISFTKIGLPPTTIINKIKTSVTSFDVSSNALIDLSANNVNGDVINEMISISSKENVSAEKEINSSNPNVMHKPGIYYYNPNDQTNPLKRVDPSVTSSQSSGGSAYYGVGSGATISQLSGGNSKMQLNNNSPVFYFYFETNANPNAESWFFATATSPKEFVLVQLNEKNKYRWVKTGSTTVVWGSVSNKSGVPDKDKIDFDYSEVSEGIYKVTFKEPLDKGEYCFMYASETPSRYTNNKLFDFGVSIEKPKK